MDRTDDTTATRPDLAPPPGRARTLLRGGVATVAVGALAACSSPAAGTSTADADFWDTSSVHTIEVTYDEADYQAMLDAYAATGDKEWIEATVVIDGEQIDDVGLRLKGNSSLRSLTSSVATADDGTADDDATTGGASADGAGDAPADDLGEGSVSADDPAGLPWLIRLDKYVDGQEYAGRTDLVVRGNTTESSLNEAVALEVLEQADVPAEQATYVRLSVNGSEEQLRLVVDLPDDDLWNDDTFENPGITYKADSSGDYSYRGEDAADYADAFEVKSSTSSLTEDEQYAPLIAFLDFVNNSTDEEFAEGLSDYLDVDSFAAYLAAQDLVQNTDDIDGPGNNSYLRWDETTGLMTVVAWDQNLSYSTGGFGGGGTGGPGGDAGDRPTMPDGTEGAQGGGPAGGPGGRQGGEAPADLPDGAAPSDLPTDAATSGTTDGTAPADLPEGAPEGGPTGGGFGGGGFGGDNTLVTRFLATDAFAEAYASATEDLTASIYASGDAQEYLDTLVAMLGEQAGDLVTQDTLDTEAAQIATAWSDS